MDVETRRLLQDIEFLSRTPRPAESAALRACREYVTATLSKSGWNVTPHAFAARSEEGKTLQGINLLARHPAGADDSHPIVCLGAHLDSRPESPGADDNASAVAGLLEIARLLPPHLAQSNACRLELAVFDLEENGMLGGAELAGRYRKQDCELLGMVSLEMIGYCDPTPNSQALPRSLVGLYPETGDFIAVIGNQNSDALVEAFAGGLRRIPGLPVETLSVPENGNLLQATRLSDHSPFWDAGFAALMITDTSFLRNPHYHQATDTAETLDPDFLTKVVAGSARAVRRIVEHGLA